MLNYVRGSPTKGDDMMSARIRKTVVPAKNSRKSQATRARIMQSATEFISERGSTDFQMNEISERCDLSKGALYYYFIDKADLMDAIFDQVIGDLVDSVERAVETTTTPLEAIYQIVITLVQCIRRERPLVFAMVEELFLPISDVDPCDSSFSRVIDLLVLNLERARDEGLIKSDFNSKRVANAIAGACIYTALGSVPREGEQPEEVVAVVREFLLTVMVGAATEKGREVIANYPD